MEATFESAGPSTGRRRRGRPMAESTGDAARDRKRAKGRERLRALRARGSAQRAQMDAIVQHDAGLDSLPQPTEINIGIRVAPEANVPHESAASEESSEDEHQQDDTCVDVSSIGKVMTRLEIAGQANTGDTDSQGADSDVDYFETHGPTQGSPSPPTTGASGSDNADRRTARDDADSSTAHRERVRPTVLTSARFFEHASRRGPGVNDSPERQSTALSSPPRSHSPATNMGGGSIDGDQQDSDAEEEEAALHRVSDKIKELLLSDEAHPIGCTTAEHIDGARSVPDGAMRVDLRGLLRSIQSPDMALMQDSMMKGREHEHPSAVAKWKRVLCGLAGDQETPPVLDLDASASQDRVSTAYDVDSFIGFANSLAFAKRGIEWTPSPNQMHNIKTDVHVQARHEGSLHALKDIPHFPLGRVTGDYDMSVHVLFPHLPSPGRKQLKDSRTFMQTAQIRKWADEVFGPALCTILPNDVLQHYPNSFEHAHLMSTAANTEARSIHTKSLYVPRSGQVYKIPPEYLDQLWSRMQETVNSQPGLMQYKEAYIVFSAKNLKLRTKFGNVDVTKGKAGALADTMKRFLQTFDEYVDLTHVNNDDLYFDIAREDCPMSRRAADTDPNAAWHAAPGNTLNHRRCCLKSIAKQLGGEDILGTKGARMRLYDQQMLHDVASMTMLAPKKSNNFAGGLVYSQFYNSIKEIMDAQTHYPFQSDVQEEMSLSDVLHKNLRASIGGRATVMKVLHEAYCHSKKRAWEAIVGSSGRSFGIRQEHRVTWALFRAVYNSCKADATATATADSTDESPFVAARTPQHALCHPTSLYLHYLGLNINKFCLGFEYVKSRSSAQTGKWEATKMMIMFLRCLRFSVSNVQLSRESALWCDTKKISSMVQHGLGFETTLEKYGYCWMMDKFDWAELTFHPSCTRRMMFGNNVLEGKWYTNIARAKRLLTDDRQFEQLLHLWELYAETKHIGTALLYAIAHSIMKVFRQEVMKNLANDIPKQYRSDAMEARSAFTLAYIKSVATQRQHVVVDVSHNRVKAQKTFAAYFKQLFMIQGPGPSWYNTKTYRAMYQAAYTLIHARQGRNMPAVDFDYCLSRVIAEYHTVMPFANADGLVPSNKDRARMWVVIGRFRSPGSKRYEFTMRTSETAEQAPKDSHIPDHVFWDEAEWDNMVQSRRSRNGNSAVGRSTIDGP